MPNFDVQQLDWLNGALRMSQSDNRQLGTTAGQRLQTYGTQSGAVNAPDMARRLLLGGDITVQGGLWRDTGVDFRGLLEPSAASGGGAGGASCGAGDASCGSSDAGGAGGGFVDMTADGTINVFGQLDVAQAGPLRKAGLMGVDVPLPTTGRVYYFRALHAGSPIHIDVSDPTPSGLLRWLTLLAVLAALGGIWRIWRVRHKLIR